MSNARPTISFGWYVVAASFVATSTAVAMLAWFGLLSLGGILLAGPASDLIGDRVPIALAFGLRVALFLLVVR